MRLVRQSETRRVTSTEITAGSSAEARTFSPADIVSLIQSHESASVDIVPVGATLGWSSSIAPTNWVICYGQSLSVTTYATLFAVISTAYGKTEDSGGNVTHFNLPPAGLFDRAFYPNSANDPGRANRTAVAAGGNSGDNVGAYQSDTNKGHGHFSVASPSSNIALSNTNALAQYQQNIGDDGYWFRGSTNSPSLGLTSESGGSEARPKNINVYKIIKYL